MKTTFGLITFVGLVILLWQIFGGLNANNEYKNDIGNYWSLADKSSTIEAKSDYINKYVDALDKAKLSGNNAILYKNPDNSFEYNYQALKTLRDRLEEIKGMNPSSFEYQQAISQITQQEQGEADAMINNFEGIWFLQHHPFYWDWISGVFCTVAIIFLCIGGMGIFVVLTEL